jgi:adenylosuccinate lyase
MSYLFSAHHKITLFRKLWIALAQAQQKLGLPIKNSQIAAMKKAAAEIDFAKVREYEKKFRHDVMAHIHAFGDLCPTAKPIIHLGATSTYVTDNGDLIQMKEALQLLHRKLIHILRLLATFAKTHARSPCLGFTHYQSAQPTTIGKRATLWLQDFYLDAQEWERLASQLPFLGAKGATGTQSSFLSLFKGDVNKVIKLEALIAKDFGFTKVLSISGQTYSRKLDLNILNALESFAASAHKMATDIRLLSHDGELAEGFGKTQVGSSAMPYKRNPIYSERICGIARFVMSLAQNPAYTLATQWLERTLDDSSNKRLAIPEAFLGADAILNLTAHLLSSLTASPQTALSRLQEQIPQLAMENILMAAVNKGGDRQALHEKLRKISSAAQKKGDPLKFLLAEIEKDSDFGLKRQEIKPLLSIPSLIGRAEGQTIAFLKEEINPYLSKRKKGPFPPVEI